MRPVRDAGHDDAIESAEDSIKRLRLGWRRGRKRSANLARRRPSHDRMVGNVATIVGDPIDDAMADGSEFLRGHGIALWA